MVLMPGLLDGVPAYTVKVHAKFPDADPAIRGVVLLHDIRDGTILAIMDSGWLTALRTGATGALGTHTLAQPDASRIAFVGCGTQARLVRDALARLRPLSGGAAFDSDPTRATAFAEDSARLGLPLKACSALAEALAEAEIVVAATWSRAPLLIAGMLRPGAHLTTLGPDQPGKVEADASLLRQARVVVDDVGLQLAMGAIGNAGLGPEAVSATLGEVLTGRRPGRASATDITVFAAVGLPWQDLALAFRAERTARAEGAACEIDLLG